MSNIDYVQEKLYLATSSLVKGNDDAKGRLLDAAISQLHRIKLGDIPIEIEADFNTMYDLITQNRTTNFEQAINALTVEEAGKINEKIFEMHNTIAKLRP